MEININNYVQENYSELGQLVKVGFLTEEMAAFLKESVEKRTNILIKGGIGSGKTTLTHALALCIPKEKLILNVSEIPEYPKEENFIFKDLHETSIKKAMLSAAPDRIVCDFRLDDIGDLLETSEIFNNGYLLQSSESKKKSILETIVDRKHSINKIASLFEIVVTTEYISGHRKVTSIEKMEINNGEIKTIELYKNPFISE